MSTLAERLRLFADKKVVESGRIWQSLVRDGADRIAALEAELSVLRTLAELRTADLASVAAERDALRNALEQIRDSDGITNHNGEWVDGTWAAIARAALQPNSPTVRHD